MKFRAPSLIYVVLATMCVVARVRAAGIEADPSKKYELSKNRGPWMIMVATFLEPDKDAQKTTDKTPAQAAQELVLELRKLSMPAYVYDYDPAQEYLTVTDRLGRDQKRTNLHHRTSISVLAGNYGDIDDKLAQDSLAWVKKLNPKCLQDGLFFTATPGRPDPLSGAFLTINPMLTPDEVERIQQHRVDPLLVGLNQGERYSLFENRGEFTLVIARFYGKDVTLKPGAETSLIKQFLKSHDVDLDDAAESARELVAVLRGNFDREQTNFNKIDAYIWHDRSESIVTVGAFASERDPTIQQYLQRFGPKLQTIDDAGTTAYQPQHFGVAGFGPKKDQKRLWIFEPEPALMRVPHPNN